MRVDAASTLAPGLVVVIGPGTVAVPETPRRAASGAAVAGAAAGLAAGRFALAAGQR